MIKRVFYPHICKVCGLNFTNNVKITRYCSKKCLYSRNGNKFNRICIYCNSPFFRHKKTSKYCSKSCSSLYRINILGYKMPLHPNTGKANHINQSIRTSLKYIEWRSKVYERDNYTCQACSQRGGLLNVHHKIPFILIINSNNIKTTEESYKVGLLWDINNGITLCRACHEKLHYHISLNN